MYFDNSIYLWIIPFNLKKYKNTSFEKNTASKLNSKIASRYLYSRAYIRESLSHILCIDPIDIPLYASPGRPPLLKKNLGFLSISYTRNIFLLGYSKYPIGVDIEHKDKYLLHKNLLDQYFSKESFLKHSEEKYERTGFLDYWVIKEAIVKFSKGNIFKDSCEWNYNENLSRAFYNNTNYYLNTFLFKIDDWNIGIASKKNNDKNKVYFCRY